MPPPTRIISLSLPKSGTTTLAHALQSAGLRVADWRIRRHQTRDVSLHDQLVAPIIYEDYFDSGDPLARLGQFHAVTEMSAVSGKMSYWPQTDFGLISAIAEHHPGARFILSLRDPDKTAKSMMSWNNLGRARLPKADVPGLPRPFGSEEAHLARWIESHYTFCMRIFQGADNFLAYELEDPDAQHKVSRFVGLKLPWWGKSNVNAANAQAAVQEG